jgi:hypothetical protein
MQIAQGRLAARRPPVTINSQWSWSSPAFVDTWRWAAAKQLRTSGALFQDMLMPTPSAEPYGLEYSPEFRPGHGGSKRTRESR